MAYRLKTVRYKQFDRKILLQNENGPCPLLAAANALLLKGLINLPTHCVRTGAASIDDVVNVLAEHALSRKAATDDDDDDGGKASSFYLNELMTLFPSLQYGMDVNPKFTLGPSGVEYTSNLTTFDMLGIPLVHGWLIDPQDTETVNHVGTKSYNELVELVIAGTDASTDLERIHSQINDLEARLSNKTNDNKTNDNNNNNNDDEDEWVQVPKATFVDEMDKGENQQEKKTEDHIVTRLAYAESNDIQAELPPSRSEEGGEDSKPSAEPSTVTVSEEEANETPAKEETKVQLVSMERHKCQERLDVLRKRSEEASHRVTRGIVIQHFLESTSHQLTYFGLMELYKHVANDNLYVFFRNNHFCTMTKHNGVLYLLVTDLGYANASNIVWEKLDAIDGATEYVSPSFLPPPPQKELIPPAPVLSPEQLLQNKGQSEADYHLALQLSQTEGSDPTTTPTTTTANAAVARNDEDERKLMAAATEASLRSYNGLDNLSLPPGVAVGIPAENVVVGGGGTMVQLPPPSISSSDVAASTATAGAGAGVGAAPSNTTPPRPAAASSSSAATTPTSTQEQADLFMALQLQATEEQPGDDASLALAQQLQAEDYQRATRQTRVRAEEAKKNACVIS